ncbi:MAG TPA: hypothetical protein VFW03_00560 [Gemmatimonadaceae bacterium]|nr:hypothetical protein [Gemmatimonadaceae bacterium]
MVARRPAALVRALLVTASFVALDVVPLARGHAQQVDSARVGARRRPPARTPAPDTVKPPISPKRAFFYSLLVPGYGQSVLNRPIAGSLFFGAEVTWIALATKSAYDLRYARAHQRDSIVVSYALDSTGAVQRDSLGRMVGATYAPNRYATERVAARRKHLEDYYALLIANHLLAGAEAFVSAQLWDVPEHVSIRALPFGPALVASFRW